MEGALRVAGNTLRDWYYSMIGLVALNLVWSVLSLTIVLMPPATAGLFVVTNSIAHGTGQEFADFVRGARRYFWVSLRWGVLNLLVAALFAVNFAFYSAARGTLATLILPALGAALFLWLGVQLYVWPFLLEQEVPRLRTALRNALFLTLGAPVYTLALLVVALALLMLSALTVLPLAIFAASFLALLGNRAVLERLTVYGKRPRPAPASSFENGDE